MKAWLLVLAACGGSEPPDNYDLHDAPVVGGAEGVCFEECGCQVLWQTGCNQGEKCSWVLSTDNGSDGMPGLGAISCSPNGTQAVGASCAFGKVAMGGYDNCVAGAICIDGTC